MSTPGPVRDDPAFRARLENGVSVPRTRAICTSGSMWCWANHPECWPDRPYRWPRFRR